MSLSSVKPKTIRSATAGKTYVDELTELSCSRRQVNDLTGIGWLTSLTFADIGKNNIVDISELSGLINLQTLKLWFNDITDVTVLSGLTDLLSLDLRYNSISTGVAELVTLVNATTIDLGSNLDGSNNASIPCSDISTLETVLGTTVVVQGYVCQ